MTDDIYNPTFVKGLFNRMAGSYERMNFITSFGFSIRWRRQFLNKLSKPISKIEIVDLLTGMGETWHSVRKVFPDSNLTALDFSEKMLDNAKVKNQTKFNNSIVVIQEDILDSRLPKNHYDIVLCAFGLKTFNKSQLKQLAITTKEILKPSGQFSFIEVSEPNNKLLKLLYMFYLKYLIPVLGKVLLGNPIEYKMLWRYTSVFKNSKTAMDIFKKQGLDCTYQSLFFGCATGFYGKIKKGSA